MKQKFVKGFEEFYNLNEVFSKEDKAIINKEIYDELVSKFIPASLDKKDPLLLHVHREFETATYKLIKLK